MEVEYKTIEGFDLYKVGSDGTLWSSNPTGHNRQPTEWRLLTTSKDRLGRTTYHIRSGGISLHGYLDEMILTVFVCDKPHNHRCVYLDGNSNNLQLSNLSWVNKDDIEYKLPELPVKEGVRYSQIPKYFGYIAGTDGSILSSKTKAGRIGKTWKIIKQFKNIHNRLYVTISINGLHKTRMVHQLILEAFVGPVPEGMECCHNNSIRTDNRLENLRWDTHENNMNDLKNSGNIKRGEQHHKSVLTEEGARLVKLRLKSGDSSARIARDLGVSVGCIKNIKYGNTWAYVKLEETSNE